MGYGMEEENFLMFSKRIERAAELVVKAHDGQFRKDEKTPYYKHPFEVAKLVQKSLDLTDSVYGEACLISALAHDCVEDVKDFDLDEFVNAIYMDKNCEREKSAVKEMVIVLTKNPLIEGRHNRDMDSYERILNSSYSGSSAIIKLCDRYSNVSDMGGMTEVFKMRYIAETFLLLGYLNRYKDYKIYQDLMKLADNKLKEVSKGLS